MSPDITRYHLFATILKIKMATIIEPGIGMWPKLVQSDQKTDFGLGEPLSELTMDKDGSSPATAGRFLVTTDFGSLQGDEDKTEKIIEKV